ncbi:MAG: hypothetical protein Q4A36_03780 [Candidatus Saccharibacteria bacterium]|nr:hypothetical protein [Candidatus Saccharibacteria bacterium]
MADDIEKLSSTNEEFQTKTEKHPLEDMPSFDLEAATRRVEEAKNNLLDKAENNNEATNDIWGNSSDEYDEYGEPDSASSLEKSNMRIPKYEKILSNPDTLQITSKNYLEQYQPESKSRADFLSGKDILDHYVLGQLSGDNAKDFIKSDQFKNYSSYIINITQQKVQNINNKKYYPELVTNPVLSNPRYRRLIISELYPADRVDSMIDSLNKNEAGYKGFLKNIENRLENSEAVSQDELNMAGDYLYSSRDFSSGLAKKFACYMFNDARQRQDLISSTQIGGALANYFAYKDTLDDRLKERRIIIANNAGWDNKNNKLKSVNTGVSTRDYCVLEQNKINDMSLSSEEGLSKSRPETITDLYSLMLVAFHELTHDYQKLMVADGKDNSSAMAYILNQVLRNNQNECFPVVDKNLNKALDENGDEVKAGYYQANHDSDEIEIQADEEAWRQCRKFIHEHEKQYYWSKKDEGGDKRASEHWFKCKENEQEVRVRRAFALKVDENGQEMPYIQYDIEELEKSIGNDLDIVKQFPQLAEFFDDAGRVKPEIFFNKRIASVDIDTMDTITDDFGVEIATYALMDSSNVKNILSYIQNPNNNLSENQVMRCVSNLWNVLHQDALKTRPLKNTNFDNYAETKTRGKNTDIGDLRESYLKQYLHQLFNATHIAEVLRDRYPELGDNIEHQEQTYFISYYNELAKDVSLESAYSEKVKNLYIKTKNRALQQIAMQL